MTNTESKSNPFASADSVPAGVNRRETDTSASYLVLPRELQVALHEAASLGSGEVHLDTAAGPGSIFAARGAIAWVARAAAESTLGDLLQLRGVASREVLRSTYQACVRDRRNFAETLIASGAVPRDAM